MSDIFSDRHQAGLSLVPRLADWNPEQPLILALPRGGVPVGAALARERDIDFDIFVVKKMPAPNTPELTMGALASGGTMVWNSQVLSRFKLPEKLTLPILEKTRKDLLAEEATYRRHLPKLPVEGRDILLVDDGSATGSTMKAAVLALRDQEVASLTVAIPVASEEAIARIQPLVSRLEVLLTPELFQNVGRWYQDYSPVSESDVETLLKSLPRALP